MADDVDDSQRTEEPSGRKLSRARDRGQVAQSREINNWFMIGTALGIVAFGGAPIARAIMDGILAGSAGFESIKIWVWRTVNQDIFERELESLESRHADIRFAHLVEG